METKNKSGFIRDLVIKIFLILLFVFLITLLFPMPNLTPFYDRIFNDNIQTMKDAADSYFTIERMPEKQGDTSKLTLQQMIDKKLILPFADKDGKACDTKKSYVKVTKKEKEYELEVHLTCGNESNYIIEHIGCYNFCSDGSCDKVIQTDEKTGKVTINKSNDNTTNNASNYKLQYLYKRTLTNTNWVTGDWSANKQNESDSVKLVDTKTQYTGQKKVEAGTTTYKHIKYAYKDNWTTDTTWTDEVKKETDTLKLADTRTLYTGQKRTAINTTTYEHIKYAYKDNWVETGYQSTKYATNDRVVLIGTRYTMQRAIKTTTGGWSAWTKDTTWRTSKPADTSTTQWSDAYNKKTSVDRKFLRYLDSKELLPYERNGSEIYVYSGPVYSSCNEPCQKTITAYRYSVYQEVTTVEYQYMYRTYSATSNISYDTITVTDPTAYKAQGYSIIKYEYNYKINKQEKYVADTKWTTSKTSPSGYEYTGKTNVATTYKYTDLGKWVTSKSALGEYTYNIKTKTQYKYKYNNPEKYIEDTKWTTSKTSPSGYEYTGDTNVTTTYKYTDLGKWVTSKSALGEYTYNIKTKTQYKYKYNNPEKYIEDIAWTDSTVSPKGYIYTGEYKNNKTTTYVDLGKWVDNKSNLGEYTYNIQTRKLYKYKTKNITTSTESKWFDSNPGADWVYANQTRKVEVSANK